MIKHAQNAGFTLREIKQILGAWGDDANSVPPDEIARLIKEKLVEVDKKLEQLTEVHAYLTAKLEKL